MGKSLQKTAQAPVRRPARRSGKQEKKTQPNPAPQKEKEAELTSRKPKMRKTGKISHRGEVASRQKWNPAMGKGGVNSAIPGFPWGGGVKRKWKKMKTTGKKSRGASIYPKGKKASVTIWTVKEESVPGKI